MKYEFDEIINRQNTNAMCVDGYKEYLFGDIDEIKLPCAEQELVSMWIADMGFAVAPEIIAAIKQRLDKQILGYTQLAGSQYQHAFLDWAQSHYGVVFNEQHLVNSQGIVPALFDLVKYLCKADDKVIIFTPSYGFFKHAVDNHQIELVSCDLIKEQNSYVMGLVRFEELAKDSKTKVCLFCNPHNPTGRVWTENELKEFARICFANNITIVSDEIHCDLLRKGQSFTPLAKLYPTNDNIITCMAPSKTFNLAGMMFASLIIPNDKLRKQWQEDHLPVVNPLSLVAAHAAYSKAGKWLQALRDYLDKNFLFLHDYLKKYLPKAVYTIPESTYLAWIDLSSYLGKEQNITLFFVEKAGVLLEGGNMFVANAQGHIRLNVACPKSILEDALNKITIAIQKEAASKP